jgi:hypothetical protein
MPRANYFFMHNKLSPLFTLCYRFNNKILRLQLLKTWEGFYRIWLPYREIFMLALLFYGLIQSNFGARIYGLIKMKRKNWNCFLRNNHQRGENVLKQGSLPFRYKWEPTQIGDGGASRITGLSGTCHSFRVKWLHSTSSGECTIKEQDWMLLLLLEMAHRLFFQTVIIRKFKKTLPGNASRQLIFCA